MKYLALALTLATLAGCGVDGKPTPPARSGVTISGDARVGVSAKL